MSRRRITLETATRRPGVNLTPIMDVVFILVIFFMLAAQFVRQAEQPLALAPAGEAVMAQDTATPQTLSLTPLEFMLDGETVAASALPAALAADPGRPLVVTVSPDAPYQALVTALDAAAKAGRTKIATRADSPGSGEAGQ
ncbi:MAG: biopolymer transporter ExbD [Zhengella sp.]|uniref:ExbD/TolR family protein n=1 Tax=Zhengella sp. TaxID=2282762 RepID=UPI001DE7CE14|nr:biopolymer transporter ExbD [Notoacmeibacter sp.]MCC0028168.1 biopolymer transporter ExbD [Brucellaceae bacterium]